MNWDQVCVCFFGGVIVGVLVAVAFLVGRRFGYWEAVSDFKSSRGIP